jgi:hypothetical protein
MKKKIEKLIEEKGSRCTSLLFIIERLEGLEGDNRWESQYDSESDYYNDLRCYEVELNTLRNSIKELKSIIK